GRAHKWKLSSWTVLPEQSSSSWNLSTETGELQDPPSSSLGVKWSSVRTRPPRPGRVEKPRRRSGSRVHHVGGDGGARPLLAARRPNDGGRPGRQPRHDLGARPAVPRPPAAREPGGPSGSANRDGGRPLAPRATRADCAGCTLPQLPD